MNERADLIEEVASQHIQVTNGSYILISSKIPLRTLSSTIWGGGYGFHRHIMNRHVDKHYNCDHPIIEMDEFLQTQGLPSADVVGMLTAAYLEDVGYHSQSYVPDANQLDSDCLHASAWVTMGLGNIARTGLERKPEELFPGTINIILVIDGNLSDCAMANCIITATEAKAAALQDLDVHVQDMNGHMRRATGTTTDAIVVAATNRGLGRTREYAGTATWLGHLIGRTVYEAAMESGRNYKKAVLHR